MCELALASDRVWVHSVRRVTSVKQMPPPPTCRIDPCLHGPGFARLWPWALALLVASGGVSCFGGQTGTELTPEDRGASAPTGSSSGTNDGDYDNDEELPETAGDSVDNAGPPPAELCDGSAAALARLEADTSVSLQSLRQFVDGANPFTLFPGDGSASTARFEFEFGAACVRSHADRVLSASLTLHVVSHDARFDFVLQGTALAYSRMPSGIGRVELDARVECAASTWGIPSSDCASLGTDMSGYVSARLATSARIQPFDDSVQLLGAVEISGLPVNGCQQESCSASTWLHVADVAMARTD